MTDDSDICPYISKHWATIDNWMGAPVAQTSRTHPKNFKRWEWNSRFPEATKNSSKRGSFTITALGLLLQDLLCLCSFFPAHWKSKSAWKMAMRADDRCKSSASNSPVPNRKNRWHHDPWSMANGEKVVTYRVLLTSSVTTACKRIDSS